MEKAKKRSERFFTNKIHRPDRAPGTAIGPGTQRLDASFPNALPS